MLELKDIDMDVDYDSLCFLESHLMHEVKRRGSTDFVKTYSESIEDFRRDWSKRDFCFLLALLKYLDDSFEYDSSVKLDKYILDSRDFLYVDLDDDLTEANLTFEKSLDSFRNRGFVYAEIEEAI